MTASLLCMHCKMFKSTISDKWSLVMGSYSFMSHWDRYDCLVLFTFLFKSMLFLMGIKMLKSRKLLS